MNRVSDRSQRVKYFVVSWYVLKTFLATGNRIPASIVTKDGIPEDAQVISAESDAPNTGSIWLLLQSESFDLVQVGDEIPILETQFNAEIPWVDGAWRMPENPFVKASER